MPDDSKAVFLSYASQDAEAARRICEALRAAGVCYPGQRKAHQRRADRPPAHQRDAVR